MATQKETSSAGPDSRSKIVLLVDASQQTGKAELCLSVFLFILVRVDRRVCTVSKLMPSVLSCFPPYILGVGGEAGCRGGDSMNLDLAVLASLSS